MSKRTQTRVRRMLYLTMLLIGIACALTAPELLIDNVVCGFDRLPQLLGVLVLAGTAALIAHWLLGFEK